MRYRAAFSVAIAFGLVFAFEAAGQTPSAAPAPTDAVGSYTPARTPDGYPDLRGTYQRVGIGGLEAHPPVDNPIDPGDKNPLSVSNRGDGLGPYPGIFNKNPMRAKRLKLPTGIVDPADKNLPWRPEADAKRKDFLSHMNPPINMRHVEQNSRCALPGLISGADGDNFYRFLQIPGLVEIMQDYNHTSRSVWTDGRPHINKNIKLFEGDSRGHWEGNTLVVDTTNFNDRTAFSREIPYFTDALHTTERFTPYDANTIAYEITIDDSTQFTRPWKVAGYFTRVPAGTESFEYACAEGSRTVVDIFGPPPAGSR